MKIKKFNEASVGPDGSIDLTPNLETVKSFKTKQDIFIIGNAREGVKGPIVGNGWYRELDITDDETSFYVKNGDELIELVSSGHISILTKDEFQSCYDSFIEYGLGDGILVRDFIGDIKVGVCTWTESNDFSESMPVDVKINTKGYIQNSRDWEEAIDDYSDYSLMVYLTLDGEYDVEKFDLEDSENYI